MPKKELVIQLSHKSLKGVDQPVRENRGWFMMQAPAPTGSPKDDISICELIQAIITISYGHTAHL